MPPPFINRGRDEEIAPMGQTGHAHTPREDKMSACRRDGRAVARRKKDTEYGQAAIGASACREVRLMRYCRLAMTLQPEIGDHILPRHATPRAGVLRARHTKSLSPAARTTVGQLTGACSPVMESRMHAPLRSHSIGQDNDFAKHHVTRMDMGTIIIRRE